MSRFGDEIYMGPGSPGYNYATPAQQDAANMAEAYTGSAYSNPNVNYVGQGTTNPGFQTAGGSAPEMVGPVDTGPGILDRIFGALDKGSDTVGKMVNIFGQRVTPVPVAPPPSSVPVWVYLAIPVALLGVVALMRRKPSGGLGYKRSRRSRRSRR